MSHGAYFDLIEDQGGPILRLKGDWIIENARDLDTALERAPSGARVDLAELGRFDMAGAYLLRKALGAKPSEALTTIGRHPAAQRLLQVAAENERAEKEIPHAEPSLRALVERAGRGVDRIGRNGIETIAFLGETIATLFRLARHPKRIRWTSVVSVMESAGLDALPIVSLLSFFVGVVVAYLGARTLSDFGASVFTVELVGVSVFREFGVVITAVLLAGRTDSAFTAEIGAMKMRQEIDAMRVMGIDVMEALVGPRVIAMIIMMPILTFAAMVSGLVGGLIACWAYLDVSPVMFLTRIQDGVPAQHFWVGMSKAPIFAIVLAVVACRHGLEVGGDVGTLGRRVTAAVVEAIFVIIALDAVFAIWFLEMDL